MADMEGEERRQPSLKNLTNPNYGSPDLPRNSELEELIAPHIDSFNYLLTDGLAHAVENIEAAELALPNGDKLAIEIKDAHIERPAVPDTNRMARTTQVYPAECRQKGSTYAGKLRLNLVLRINGIPVDGTVLSGGKVPIMVRSLACNLAECDTRAKMIERGEEGDENGGYFIINGNEKIIRMLVAQRRNYPLCLTRTSWKKRIANCTKYGLTARCVAPDQNATNLMLHYLNNGSVSLCIAYHKELFFIPIMLILKALMNVPDKHICDLLVQANSQDMFFQTCVKAMLKEVIGLNLITQNQSLAHLGSQFRPKLNRPEWHTDVQIGQYLIRKCIATHLSEFVEKFHFLIYMVQKLYAFTCGQCTEESVDNPQFHEVLLSGHIYLSLLKEKMEAWLWGMKDGIRRNIQDPKFEIHYNLLSLTKNFKGLLDIGSSMEYFLATGNLVSRDSLGLQQTSGFAVVADRLNFARFLSHFRCLHRGAHFTSMRNSSVRRLQPESWGFICPVHTPDGPPCGLMNHLTASCKVVNKLFHAGRDLKAMLMGLGLQFANDWSLGMGDNVSVIMLDGCVIGYVSMDILQEIATHLRHLKVTGHKLVPADMEIVLIETKEEVAQFPGLYLFTDVGRLIRPVRNLHYAKEEYIGIFEQVYLSIAQENDNLGEKEWTHVELKTQNFLSTLASMTPFSDHNQAPRNIYQCQMMKQTMGTPVHAFQYRADNKLYRLNTPQSPLVRPVSHTAYDMDQYPLGTNAIVAVITYSGYDMEDAVIINKSSLERGLFRGTVYKAEFINLRGKESGPLPMTFGASPENRAVQEGFLNVDGLPPVGRFLQKGEPFYCLFNVQTGEYKMHHYKKDESCYVDQVKVLGHDSGIFSMEKVCFILRTVRTPVVGDKFASRHGQKGTLSMVWPQEDLPYTEGGMVPDILFNPHSYPSRMTIGMLIESIAGKSAAIQGHCYDSTPFSFSEEAPTVETFGNYLQKAGYHYYGHEEMYSGVNGLPLKANIFIGNVYYQRLRHMVDDKVQVRTVGLMDNVTQQPVKGRKRGGGVRFGEMERDALISIGSASAALDRLAHCSDFSKVFVCTACGSTESSTLSKPVVDSSGTPTPSHGQVICNRCQARSGVRTIHTPYVLKYLISELISMNIEPQVVFNPRHG